MPHRGHLVFARDEPGALGILRVIGGHRDLARNVGKDD